MSAHSVVGVSTGSYNPSQASGAFAPGGSQSGNWNNNWRNFQKSDRSCSVFVGNLPYDSDENHLTAIFSRVGEVVSFRIMTDRQTGAPKGYGFCEYRDMETAYTAMRNLNGVEYGGRPLRVDWADHELRNQDGLNKVMRAQGTESAKAPFLGGDVMGIYDGADQIPIEDVTMHTELAAMLTRMPTSQLLQFLGHMQSLCVLQPEEGRQVLEKNPHLALAVQHAAYLLGKTEEPMLPMTLEDTVFAEERRGVLADKGLSPGEPISVTKTLGIAKSAYNAIFEQRVGGDALGGGGGGMAA